MEACINEQLPLTTELEEGLRNGVFLAKLAHFMCPEHVSLKKIYDRDQSRFQVNNLRTHTHTQVFRAKNSSQNAIITTLQLKADWVIHN